MSALKKLKKKLLYNYYFVSYLGKKRGYLILHSYHQRPL